MKMFNDEMRRYYRARPMLGKVMNDYTYIYLYKSKTKSCIIYAT